MTPGTDLNQLSTPELEALEKNWCETLTQLDSSRRLSSSQGLIQTCTDTLIIKRVDEIRNILDNRKLLPPPPLLRAACVPR